MHILKLANDSVKTNQKAKTPDNIKYPQKMPYIFHLQSVMSSPAFQEWPVKEITIVSDKYTGLLLLHVGKPLLKKLELGERTCGIYKAIWLAI